MMHPRTQAPRNSAGRFIVLSIFLILLVLFFVRPWQRGSEHTDTLLIVGNPMVLIAARGERVHAFVLSDSVYTTAVRGYGSYSLKAIAEFDRIDRFNGQLLMETFEETFGIPVRAFVRSSVPNTPAADVHEDFIRKQFSFGRLWQLLKQRSLSNLSLMQFIRIGQYLRGIQHDGVGIVNLNDTPVVVDTKQADGSTVQEIDPLRLDELYADKLELPPIRREALRAAVYNSTDFPSLGQRLARLISNSGVVVVTVGNEPPATDRCIVYSKNEIRESITVQAIVGLFDCLLEPLGGDESVDMQIKIGTQYKERFQSKAK